MDILLVLLLQQHVLQLEPQEVQARAHLPAGIENPLQRDRHSQDCQRAPHLEVPGLNAAHQEPTRVGQVPEAVHPHHASPQERNAERGKHASCLEQA